MSEICESCGESYSVRDGCEPTPYCDACAHEKLERCEAALEMVLAFYRVGSWAFEDGQEWNRLWRVATDTEDKPVPVYEVTTKRMCDAIRAALGKQNKDETKGKPC